MNEALAVAKFSALANATRLRMLKFLVGVGESGASAGEVAEVVGATPSRASFHLSVMSEVGLIKSTRVSRYITYYVDFAVVGDLISYLMQDCCQNNKTVMGCCSVKNIC